MTLSAPAARLEHLEATRARYEALSRKLFTLPNTLRHPGLIPVGPRLYLPGELVNPAHLTVLLGSSGADTFFAERSALQALGIVQRRLAAVDEAVKKVHVRDEVGLGAPGKEDPFQEDALRGQVWQEALRPQDLSVVVADAATSNIGVAAKTKKKKRVSFSEPMVTGVLSPLPVKEEKKASGKNKGKMASSSAERRGDRKGSSSKRATRAEFIAALRSAHQQTLDDGVVSFTEVHDGGEVKAEFPEGFTPDSAISFAEGSEDFLDVTRPKKADPGVLDQTEKVLDLNEREDFLAALLEAEREAEADEARSDETDRVLDPDETEDFLASVLKAKPEVQAKDAAIAQTEKPRQEKRNEDPEREFGNGFSKGFLGATAVKQKPEVVPTKNSILDVPSEEVRGPKVVETLEQTSEVERIVERRAPRVSRRRRRTGASGILAARGMPTPAYVPNDVREEPPCPIEDIREEVEEAPVSKFRQMRNMQR